MTDKLYDALNRTYKTFSLDSPGNQRERDVFRGAYQALKSFWLTCHTPEEDNFCDAVFENILYNYYVSDPMSDLRLLTQKAEDIRDIAKAIVDSMKGNGYVDSELLTVNLKQISNPDDCDDSWSCNFFGLFFASKTTKICNNILMTSKRYLNSSSAEGFMENKKFI